MDSTGGAKKKLSCDTDPVACRFIGGGVRRKPASSSRQTRTKSKTRGRSRSRVRVRSRSPVKTKTNRRSRSRSVSRMRSKRTSRRKQSGGYVAGQEFIEILDDLIHRLERL